MPRRTHGKPRQPVGVIVAIFERIEWAGEPFAGVRKFCGEFLHYFVADFVAATANARAQRGEHVLRARAKFHSHAAQSFFGYALRCAAPARVNRGNGALPGIGKQDGNAVRSLNGQQDAGFASDQGVALQRLFALRGLRGAHDVHNIGVNLAQGNGAHFAGAERCEEFRAILQDAVARIPVRESQVQDFIRNTLFSGAWTVSIRDSFASSTGTRAETVNQPA